MAAARIRLARLEWARAWLCKASIFECCSRQFKALCSYRTFQVHEVNNRALARRILLDQFLTGIALPTDESTSSTVWCMRQAVLTVLSIVPCTATRPVYGTLLYGTFQCSGDHKCIMRRAHSGCKSHCLQCAQDMFFEDE